MFKYTDAIKKLRKLKKRIRIVPGGTSAGKTFGILPILIDTAIRTPNLEISVVSESVPHLRKGSLKDFIKIMRDTNRWIDSHYNKTLLTYTFSNNSYIEFFSADQEGKVRGPRRNILYVNECNNISFETYHQLAIRTDGDIWLDFNPSHEFWAHTELRNDEDADWLTLTYKDNSALAESIVKEIEKGRNKAYFNIDLPIPKLFEESNIKNQFWHNWWRVYGCGLLGSLEGVVFSNWKQIDKIPANAKLLGYGQDFGFTNDPTTLVGLYSCEGKYYWDEVIYKKGLVNSEIVDEYKSNKIDSESEIFADCAEPKSIEEIHRYGFNIKPCSKGADSILFGIGLLQQEEFFVTKRSVNLIKELRNYCWATDKAGNSLNKAIDAYNHIIDAMRYIAIEKLKQYSENYFEVYEEPEDYDDEEEDFY